MTLGKKVSMDFPEGTEFQASSVSPEERASRIKMNEAKITSSIKRDERLHLFMLAATSVVIVVCAIGFFLAESSLKPLCLDTLKVIITGVVAYKAGEWKVKQ